MAELRPHGLFRQKYGLTSGAGDPKRMARAAAFVIGPATDISNLDLWVLSARVAPRIRRDSPYNRMTQSFNVFNAVVQFITFSTFLVVAFEFFMVCIQVMFKLCGPAALTVC